jgi:ATP-binding cassette subfamily B protein
MAMLLVQGLLPAISITLTRQLVNNLVVVAGGGFSWESLEKILMPIGLMASILLLGEFFNACG